MSWDFQTDPAFQEKLDWMATFVREEVEPLDALWGRQIYERPMDPTLQQIVRPLQDEVRAQELWACHLGPELGGPGYGQLKLALMNEILGRSPWAPTIFGTQAPDTGNAEILAHFGTEAQKATYLQPLLDGDIVSCYSMTEPQGGADPKVFTTRAVRDGDEWVINGWKFFSSNARWASFLIVMTVTDPDVPIYKGASMFIVPAGTPGLNIVRNIGLGDEPLNEGSHGLVHYDDVRVPAENLLGGEGQAFAVAQTRLGGGRIHHAMRTVGLVRYAFDMLCERALSRVSQGSQLARKQAVEQFIAESWIQIEQFRLLVLQTAWKIDKFNDYRKVRADISAVKAAMPAVLHDVAARALQVHGSLGASDEMPFGQMIMSAFQMGLVDGATEIHKSTLARQVLRQYEPTEDLFPTQHLPRLRAAARDKYADVLN
jgi:acyl-CoA dehydrogenase